MTADFLPLRQRTTPESVYEVLRTAILNHDLKPGDQLREAHLALSLGISRGPLRESLSRLEEEGLVTRIPFRGAFVAEVSAEKIGEIAAVRVMVEPQAAVLAMPSLRENDGELILGAVQRMRAAADAGDIGASVDTHMDFHRLFYEYSGNGVLLDLWRGWESQLRLFLGADHQRFGDLSELSCAHEELARLILSEDAESVAAHLVDHIHRAPGESMRGQDVSIAARGAGSR